MGNLDGRLTRLEQAAAERDRPQIAGLVQFVFAQPPADAAAVWRVVHADLGRAATDPLELELCGGSFELEPDDRAVYNRLLTEFFGRGGGPEAPPEPMPAPTLELAEV